MKKIDSFLPFMLLEKGEDIIHNNIVKRAIVSDTGEKAKFENDKFIRTNFEIKVGDIIIYKNEKWIVYSDVDSTRNSYKARIRKTNYSIKIVVNNKVEVLDCVFTNYNNKIDVTKFLTTLEDMITFTVPESEITNSIKLEFRFIKFSRAWKILGRDYTKKGLIEFTAKTDVFGVNDDKENEIANKNLIIDKAIIDAQDLAIITNLANTVTFINTELTENITIPLLSSENVTATWTSNNPSYLSDTGIVTRPAETEADASVNLTLTLKKGTQTITKTFNFTILAEVPELANLFTIEILGEEKISFGTIQTYTAIVKNNGIEDSGQTVTFSLENIIRATPVIQSIDGNICNITNRTTSAGTFVLKAILDSDNAIFIERKLKINI